MNKVTVYKLDSTGRQRQWSIWVEEGSGVGVIRMESGLTDGEKVPQQIEITKGKNLGKANATTPYTQAVAEAEAKLELQLRSGYVRDIADLKASGTLGSGMRQPMLAQKYHPTGEQKGSKTLSKMKLLGFPIHVQPKLDGNRCLIKVETTPNGAQAVMYTRKGDVMPVQLQGLIREVLFCYDKMGLTEEIILDGELFSNSMSFNELNGHLKRKSSQNPKALDSIKYHLYDCMVDLPYDTRYTNLQNFVGKAGEHGMELRYIKLVPSYPIRATDANIKEKLEEFLAEGHEGLMIRTLDTGYENKRTWQLCKVKIFEDDEFEILDLEEDAMGRLGYFIMKLKEPAVDADGKLVTDFKAGLSGVDHETGKKMLEEKSKYIGKMATIEFFGWGVARPRFPKFKAVRQA